MRATAIATILGIILPATLWAQTTRPAATRPSKPPELCKDAVDPYDAGAERTRFFAAAGVDSELSREEFEANRGAADPFVRKFDRWEALLAFDKDGNKTLDWFEVDAYRQDLRRRVLGAFDLNKDHSLTGAERDAANAALAKGRVPAGPAAATGRPMPTTSAAPRDGAWAQADTDADGLISEQERLAAMEKMREQMRQRMLREWDTDGDGEISEQERQAMREARRKANAPMKDLMEGWKMTLFDSDQDGELSEEEQQAARQFEKELGGIGERMRERMMDIDGDGEVTREERQQFFRESAVAGMRQMGAMQKWLDADGDGEVTIEERAAFNARMADGLERWLDGFAKPYRPADGAWDSAGRKALVEGLEKEVMRREKKFDANADGRLDPAEMMNMMIDFAEELGVAPKEAGAARPAL